MNPDKQKIAIAEACGLAVFGVFSEETMNKVGIPDYLNSLDAVREALETLEPSERFDYLCELESVLGNNSGPGGWDLDTTSLWKLVSAAPSQHAEAFLKAIGKWEDDK